MQKGIRPATKGARHLFRFSARPPKRVRRRWDVRVVKRRERRPRGAVRGCALVYLTARPLLIAPAHGRPLHSPGTQAAVRANFVPVAKRSGLFYDPPNSGPMSERLRLYTAFFQNHFLAATIQSTRKERGLQAAETSARSDRCNPPKCAPSLTIW